MGPSFTLLVIYILRSRSLFQLVSDDSFWLSQVPIFLRYIVAHVSNSNTPFQPSKYPGACYRICTAAQFIYTLNSKPFTYLNTHLDDQSDDQRRLAASLLLTRARYEAVNTQAPVLISGDFNSPQTGQDSGAYKITTGEQMAVAVNTRFAAKYAVGDDELPDFRLVDLKAVTPRFGVSGNYATYTGWNAPNNSNAYTRIDFLFGGNNGGW